MMTYECWSWKHGTKRGPIEIEAVSEYEAQKYAAPKLRIPREQVALREVKPLSKCIKRK